MRTIGHFLIFVAFFLVLALVLGLLVLSAAALQSFLVLLMILPALPGLYFLYTRSCRALADRSNDRGPSRSP